MTSPWKIGCALLLLTGALRAAPPSSSADGEIIRLEQAISTASEQGRLEELWKLRHQLADYAKESGYWLQAARQYELLLASRPGRRDRVRLSIELGHMRDAVKDYRGAIQAYEDALHDDSHSWEARLALGRAYANIDLFKQSEDTYLAALRQDPKSPAAHRELGALYMKRGYLQKAQAAYETSIQLDPKNPESYLGLSETYSRMASFPLALSTLDQAARVAPSPDYQARMGELYRRQGDWAKAVNAWETTLKQDSKRDDVRLNLALLYDRLNRPSDADRAMNTLLKQYPDSPLVHLCKAWILFKRGDRAGAKRESAQAQGLNPTELVLHYNSQLIERLDQRP